MTPSGQQILRDFLERGAVGPDTLLRNYTIITFVSDASGQPVAVGERADFCRAMKLAYDSVEGVQVQSAAMVRTWIQARRVYTVPQGKYAACIRWHIVHHPWYAGQPDRAIALARQIVEQSPRDLDSGEIDVMEALAAFISQSLAALADLSVAAGPQQTILMDERDQLLRRHFFRRVSNVRRALTCNSDYLERAEQALRNDPYLRGYVDNRAARPGERDMMVERFIVHVEQTARPISGNVYLGLRP